VAVAAVDTLGAAIYMLAARVHREVVEVDLVICLVAVAVEALVEMEEIRLLW
jgi:hypothetical protein